MSPLLKLMLALAVCELPAVQAAAQESGKPAVPEVSAGSIVWWPDFAPAEAVGVSDIWIWLPESYAAEPERRYPVLYMHDAENIFDRRLSNFDKEWGLDEAITRLARSRDGANRLSRAAPSSAPSMRRMRGRSGWIFR